MEQLEKNNNVTTENEVVILDASTENEWVLTFKKPYVFEGQAYTELDLSGLEDVTAADIIAVNKIMTRQGDGANMMPEMSMQFACVMAARVTRRPIEFFNAMPARESMKLKTMVAGFMFGED